MKEDITFRDWFLAGFPSPWRWLRRKYWRYKYNKLSTDKKSLMRFVGADPETLIRRGYL